MSARAPYRTQLIVPRARPYGALRGLAVMARNPARWWSAGMYDEGVRAVPVLGRTFLHVARPELARTVLLDEASAFGRSFIVQPMLEPAMGGGLLTSDGEAWRRQRSLLAPVFRRRVLDGYLDAFDRHGRACVERLRRFDGEIVRVLPEMVTTTLDVIIETLFGDVAVDRTRIARDTATYLEVLGRVDPLTVLGVPAAIPRPGRSRGLKAVASLRRLAHDVIASQRASGIFDASLIGRLLAAVDPDTGAGLDDELIVDNVLTFIGAGHETTSVALAWSLYLLAAQPELANALADESRELLGRMGEDGVIDRAALDALDLHRRVVSESMRLYPPAAAIVRSVLREVRVGELDLVPGDHVTVATMPMHRNPAFWPDPHAFDADRFLGERRYERFAYLPFGDGPRTCIGATFALDEAIVVLARLSASLRFEPSGGPPPVPVLSVTLRPDDGMALRVRVAT